MSERVLSSRFPRTHEYLKYFEESLRARAAYKKYLEPAGEPFYALYDIKRYTFSDWKVVWARFGSRIDASVVALIDGKAVMPQETHVFVDLADADEAFYLAGMMNSMVFNFAALSYSQVGGKSFGSPHILDNLHVPTFDASNGEHSRIAHLAHEIQRDVESLNNSELELYDARLDEAAAAVWGISDIELAEIRESYRELTKADLREARETVNAREEGSEEGEGGSASTEAIVAAMDGNGEMTTAEIAAAVGIDTVALRPVLRRLIDTGQVDRTGRGRGTRYRLIEGGEA